MLLLEGPAGVGKSALLTVAREQGAALGFTVGEATGRELQHGFAFGAAVELLAGPIATITDDEREEAFAGAAALVRPLYDASAPGPAASEPFTGLHGLHWLCANLAERRPLLLVVDDAHWCDRLSLDFLVHLADRVAELPVCLLVAVREGESEAGAHLCGALAQADATTLHPGPLSADAVRRLLNDHPGTEDDDALAARLTRLTGGNPLYVRELLRSLDQDPGPAGDTLAEHVPRTDRRRVAVAPRQGHLRHLPARRARRARTPARQGHPDRRENHYYRGGDDDGRAHCAALGLDIGMASGWEWARHRTANRLRGVDLVLGGMCWPSFPLNWTAPGLAWWVRREHAIWRRQCRELPSRFARLVGAPVAHAAHVGPVDAQFPAVPAIPWRTQTLGETQLCAADGTVLARLSLEDGEGHVAADLTPGSVAPLDETTDRFWIPVMTASTHAAWHMMNTHGRLDYRLKKLRGKHEWQSWPAGDLPDELPPVPDEQAQHFATTR